VGEDLVEGGLDEVGLVDKALFELRQAVVAQLHRLLATQSDRGVVRRGEEAELLQVRLQVVHRLLLSLCQLLSLLTLLQ